MKKSLFAAVFAVLSAAGCNSYLDFKLWDPDLQTGAANYPNNRVYNIGVSLIF